MSWKAAGKMDHLLGVPKMALFCRSGEFWDSVSSYWLFLFDFERYGTTGKYFKLGGDSCVEV